MHHASNTNANNNKATKGYLIFLLFMVLQHFPTPPLFTFDRLMQMRMPMACAGGVFIGGALGRNGGALGR